ncbi:MAG: antitoxin [Lachnospiraceae bacterium]|nr:antitoxin [Lachnospiraceae bacterium]
MRKIDNYGRKMCSLQAKVFAQSKEEVSCSSRIFLRRFMYSYVAKRMDKDGFLFGSDSSSDILIEIEDEFGTSDYGREKFDEEELYWIGYVYRYWAYTREIPSKQIYHIIKPEELRTFYLPYHSLDTEVVVERILEAKGRTEEEEFHRAVEIMRQVRAKRAEKNCMGNTRRN